MNCLSNLHTNMIKGISLSYSSWRLKTKSTATNSCSFYLTKSQEKCMVKFLTHFGPQVGRHFKATGNSLKILHSSIWARRQWAKGIRYYLQRAPAEAVLNKVEYFRENNNTSYAIIKWVINITVIFTIYNYQ